MTKQEVSIIDMINVEKLREVLDSVVWYNGYWEIVKEWIEALANPKGKYIYRPDEYDGDGGLEVLWMMCVLMFGNYGTSPRSGWVENTEQCREFLIWITKNTKEYEEYCEEN